MKTIARLFTGLLKLCIILPMLVAGAALGGWAGSHLPGALALPGMLGGYVLGCFIGGWLGAMLTRWGGVNAGGSYGYTGGSIPSSYVAPNYGINPANGLRMRNATHDVFGNLKFHDFYKDQAAEQQRIRDHWERR